MPQALLTRRQIVELDEALVEAYRLLADLRERLPAAARIQFPPMPSMLSESLVAALASPLFGPGWHATSGKPKSDLLLIKAGSTPLRVEVKATGASGFQEFKPKDLRADSLVWLAFGERYRNGEGPFVVYRLDAPQVHVTGPRSRITLGNFVTEFEALEDFHVFHFDSVEAAVDVLPAPEGGSAR